MTGLASSTNTSPVATATGTGTATAGAGAGSAAAATGAPASPSRPWRRALLWLAGLAPLFYLSYGAANHWAAQRALVSTVFFEWERQLPFWAWTIVPYWTINAFYGLSLLLTRRRHELDRHGARLLSAQLIAVACFLIWPLRFGFSQPAVDGGLPGFLFAGLRSFDAPFNQAPSLHIALAVILWDFYRRQIHAGWARVVMHVWALAIGASVLTTYQHHFIDIPTGALLGWLCVWAWPLERRVSMAQAWRLTGDAQRLKLAAYYAVGAVLCAALAQALGGTALWLWWGSAALGLVALIYLGFGVRGFQTDAQGRMSLAARWLLAPYRLGAWINARLWTRRLNAADEVVPGVWLGHLPGKMSGHVSAGASTSTVSHKPALVSLCAELQAPVDARTRCVPMLDLVVPAPATLRRAALAIDGQVRAIGQVPGRAVLVSCGLGFSRGAASMACWLVRSGRAADVAQAVQRLRQARPQIVLSAAWLAALEAAVASPTTDRQATP